LEVFYRKTALQDKQIRSNSSEAACRKETEGNMAKVTALLVRFPRGERRETAQRTRDERNQRGELEEGFAIELWTSVL